MSITPRAHKKKGSNNSNSSSNNSNHAYNYGSTGRKKKAPLDFGTLQYDDKIRTISKRSGQGKEQIILGQYVKRIFSIPHLQ